MNGRNKKKNNLTRGEQQTHWHNSEKCGFLPLMEQYEVTKGDGGEWGGVG